MTFSSFREASPNSSVSRSSHERSCGPRESKIHIFFKNGSINMIEFFVVRGTRDPAERCEVKVAGGWQYGNKRIAF